MPLRADQRLFVSYLVLITSVVAALGLGTGWTLRPRLIGMIADGLQREVRLGRELRARDPHLPPDSLVALLGRVSGRRVTLIRADGIVLGESEPGVETPRADDYLARPEVRAALETGEGVAVRSSRTVGTDHLYLARRLDDGTLLRFAVPLSEVDAAVGRVRRGIVGAGLLALLVAALLSLGFSRAVTRPLRRIRDVARAIAAGELQRRVEVRRNDELGEVGVALNALAAELERRLGQLEAERFEMRALIDSMAEGVLALSLDGRVRRANPAARRMFGLREDPQGLPAEAVARRPEVLGLIRRGLAGESVAPTELMHGGRNLLATARALPDGGAVIVFLDVSELRRLEGVRRDFVANVSHELKTPLTAIRGYSDTLLDETLPPELAHRFAGVIHSNAERLQHLVDDLLDLSRIESGGWAAQPEVVELPALAARAWGEAATSPRARELDFRVDVAGDAGWLEADPDALTQVLQNLFSNAIRYTPAGGSVVLRARRSAAASGFVRVEVGDTGSGIPAAHLPRIFERFYRVDPARSRAEGGTGLGLAIVKHLVEAHGGEVGATSEIGRGTTVWFTLPSATSDDAAAPGR